MNARTTGAWLSAALALACAAARADFIVAARGTNGCPVYAPREEPQAAAARDLTNYLGRITGASFALAAAPDPALPRDGIVLRAPDTALAAAHGDDSFVIRVSDSQVELTGATPTALRYAVYEFLASLGCRWWSFSEEDVPRRPTLAVKAGPERLYAPRFAMHDLFNREGQTPVNAFNMKCRGASAEAITGGHNLCPMLKPYAEKNLAFYPMGKDGQRKGNDLHMCYTAAGMSEALAEALEAEIARRGTNVRNFIYFAGMGDWYGGMCECPACKAVYDEELWTDPDGRKKPGYSATLVRMLNRTAGILESRHPGIRVGTFAYMSLEAPPAATVPRGNVVIMVPRLRHCGVHPAATCPENQSFRRNLERWCELAPGRVYIWDYGINFDNFMFPYPCTASIADNIRFYDRLGVRGIMIQGNYVTTGGDLTVLRNYVWGRLLWGPDREPADLVAEFCEGYYGPAAREMRDYVDTLDRGVAEPVPIHAHEFTPPAYLPSTTLARLAGLRDRALRRTRGREPYARRVREGTLGLEALRLWKTGPLEERGDTLVRADLGAYTYPRALEFIACSRDASPKEWGLHRSYQQGFLTMHGGPLLTVRSGPLAARIAPVLGGQIRRLLYLTNDLLYVEASAAARGYPLVGGSLDGVDVAVMAATGEVTEARVRLQGEAGIAHWSPNTKQLVWKTIEAGPAGAITVTGSARAVAPGADKRSASIRTVYAAGADPAALRVDRQAPDGSWTPVDLAANPTQDVQAAAVRIAFPDRGCRLTDSYSLAEVEKVQVALDRAARTLAVTVTPRPASVPAEGEAVFYSRRIVVEPL